ncbi:MAG: hypothetical protein IPP74_14465 [Alphaproteobacteria bacterium]|nr:hypothetical protein [Alphaproteobacteria bacterium]
MYKQTPAGQKNRNILSAFDSETQFEVLGSIAKHYGCSIKEIEDEIFDENAEYLLDYMPEPHRRALCVLINRSGV